MTGTAPPKKNDYIVVGVRVISKASLVVYLSECSRRYSSASKTKI